ncbi:MAG: hypothetical protein ACQKBY_13045 [Verrucomicrobiales bacterium]
MKRATVEKLEGKHPPQLELFPGFLDTELPEEIKRVVEIKIPGIGEKNTEKKIATLLKTRAFTTGVPANIPPPPTTPPRPRM